MIPFGAKLSYTTIVSIDESRHQFGKKMLAGIFRREGGQVTCSLQISNTGKNLSTSTVHVKEVSPCAGGTLELFDLPRPRRGENPAEGNLLRDELENMKEQSSKKKTQTISRA